MKINVIQSTFGDNSKPYLELLEPFVRDDFDINIEKSSDDPSSMVGQKFYDNFHRANVILIPKKNIEEILTKYGIFGSIFDDIKLGYGNDIKKVKGLSKGLSKQVKFTGIKTDAKKVLRFTETYDEFIDDVNSQLDDIINRILSGVNSGGYSLSKMLNRFNEDYDRDISFFFKGYNNEVYWEKQFSKHEEYNKLLESSELLQVQLDKLYSSMNEINNNIQDFKIKNGKRLLDQIEIQGDVKKRIEKLYDDKEVWKMHKLGKNERGLF